MAPIERLKILMQVQGNEKVYTNMWQVCFRPPPSILPHRPLTGPRHWVQCQDSAMRVCMSLLIHQTILNSVLCILVGWNVR